VSVEVPTDSGWIAPELAEEFPHLGLRHASVAAGPGPTPREVKRRLRRMSDRYTGARAIHLRQESVPWAYRVFFRQVGIDPDERRTPVEEAALDRMFHGGFRSRGRVDDALLIAVVETGVPVTALDADRLDGEIGLRLSGRGERLAGARYPLVPGRMVVADRSAPVAMLFGEVAPSRTVGRSTERILLAAVQVKGVPELIVEEALWTAAGVLTAPE
jgi:DNA/RNA-binding domain of Phe-tRNA-synthetase-like protein